MEICDDKNTPWKVKISILFPASCVNSHEMIGALRYSAVIALNYEEIGINTLQLLHSIASSTFNSSYN